MKLSDLIQYPTGGGGGTDATNINIIEFADTPNSYDDGKILKSSAGETEWIFHRGLFSGDGGPDSSTGNRNDHYLDKASGDLYKKGDPVYVPFIDDDFSTLDGSVWSTRTVYEGSVDVIGSTLNLSCTSYDNNNASCIYTVNSFQKTGVIYFSCDWKPHKNSDGGMYHSTIQFATDTSNWYNAGSCIRLPPDFQVHLGLSGDTTDRTGITISEGFPVTHTASIDIDETIWHDLEILVDCDSRNLKVYIDSSIIVDVTLGATNWNSMGTDLDLNIHQRNKANASTEQFDNIILAYGSNPWATPVYNLVDTTSINLIDLADTPDSYDAGKILKSNAAGTEWVDIISEGSNNFSAASGTPDGAFGNYNDYYLDTDSNILYQKTYGTSSGWNPSDRLGNTGLSNNNTVVTHIGTDGWSQCGVRSTQSKSSGKWYFEIVITVSSESDDIFVAIGRSPGTLNIPGLDSYSYGYYGNSGIKKTNDVNTAYGDAFGLNDIIGTALDLDNNKIWWSKNGVWQNGGDPAAGTGEAFSITSAAYNAQTGLLYADDQITAKFSSNELTYSAPSGFTAGFVGGTLSWEVVGGIGGADATNINIIELADTPNSYDNGKFLKSTASGTEWDDAGGGDSPWTLCTTDGYNAQVGDKLLVDATAVTTINLPSSPSPHDTVEIADAYGIFTSNEVTIDPGSNNIRGASDSVIMDVDWDRLLFVWVDNNTGWRF